VSGGTHLFDEGFDATFDALFDVAYGVGLRILGQPADAEDVASEALARTLVRWSQLHDADHLHAWVAKVAGNLAVDRTRRRRRLAGDVGPEASVDHRAEEVVLRDALRDALARLPRRQREVVVLRHLVGLPEADVAAALRISVNSVKKHAQRALQKLRIDLGSDEEVRLAQ